MTAKRSATRQATLLLLAACVWGTSSGCATMFAPGPDVVPVSSTPSGARVYLDSRHVGVTPTAVSIDRASEGLFRFELEGYETAIIDRNKVANGFAFLNLLGGWITLPLFFLIDIASGNIGKYSSNPLHVDLVPKKAAPDLPPVVSDTK